MCHRNRIRERQSSTEKTKDEETVIEETPSREQPTSGIIDIPMKALKQAKAFLSI